MKLLFKVVVCMNGKLVQFVIPRSGIVILMDDLGYMGYLDKNQIFLDDDNIA